jgi:hypothetical protein
MVQSFKKNQPVVATLPTGRVVEGFYIEPWSDDGHSFYVNEYDGMRGGKPVYREVRYGVKDEFISPATVDDDDIDEPSDEQYNAWIKRAETLEERIKADKDALKKLDKDSKDTDKLMKRIERNKSKLDQINEKINQYEEEKE